MVLLSSVVPFEKIENSRCEFIRSLLGNEVSAIRNYKFSHVFRNKAHLIRDAIPACSGSADSQDRERQFIVLRMGKLVSDQKRDALDSQSLARLMGIN